MRRNGFVQGRVGGCITRPGLPIRPNSRTDLNGPAPPRQRWSGPQHNTQRVRGSSGAPDPGGPQSLAGPPALLDSAAA